VEQWAVFHASLKHRAGNPPIVEAFYSLHEGWPGIGRLTQAGRDVPTSHCYKQMAS